MCWLITKIKILFVFFIFNFSSIYCQTKPSILDLELLDVYILQIKADSLFSEVQCHCNYESKKYINSSVVKFNVLSIILMNDTSVYNIEELLKIQYAVFPIGIVNKIKVGSTYYVSFFNSKNINYLFANEIFEVEKDFSQYLIKQHAVIVGPTKCRLKSPLLVQTSTFVRK